MCDGRAERQLAAVREWCQVAIALHSGGEVYPEDVAEALLLLIEGVK